MERESSVGQSETENIVMVCEKVEAERVWMGAMDEGKHHGTLHGGRQACRGLWKVAVVASVDVVAGHTCVKKHYNLPSNSICGLQ